MLQELLMACHILLVRLAFVSTVLIFQLSTYNLVVTPERNFWASVWEMSSTLLVIRSVSLVFTSNWEQHSV